MIFRGCHLNTLKLTNSYVTQCTFRLVSQFSLITLNHLEGDITWCFMFYFPWLESFSFLILKSSSSLFSTSTLLGFTSSVPYYHLSSIFHNCCTLGVQSKRMNFQHNMGNQPSTCVYIVIFATSCNSKSVIIYNGKGFITLGTQRDKIFVGQKPVMG